MAIIYKIAFLLSISFLFFSCKNGKTRNEPASHFIRFTAYMDSLGFQTGIERAQKVGNFQQTKYDYYDKKVFFEVNPAEHALYQNKESWIRDVSDLDCEIFKNSISIFSYYYYDKKKSLILTDGVIEEWKFGTTNKAKKAAVEFEKINDAIYFNTESYYFQHKNYLYIFHTRASAFDPKLKEFYIIFKQKINT